MRRGLLILCCWPAAPSVRALDVAPAATPGFVEPVYVATMRALLADGSFGSERSEALSYLSLDISIPPDREPGQIAYRKNGKLDPEKQFFATARTDFSDRAPVSHPARDRAEGSRYRGRGDHLRPRLQHHVRRWGLPDRATDP